MNCAHVETSGSQPPVRTNHASGFYNNQLVVYGGNADSKYNGYEDVWVLETMTMVWSQPKVSGALPGPRCHHTMTVIGNKAWVFGGWTGKRRCNFLHTLDLDSWKWENLTAKMSHIDPHSSHAAAAIDSNDIIVLGRGETGTHAKYGCNIDYLNIKTLQWSTLPGSSISRAGHSLTFSPAASMHYATAFGGRQRHMVEQIICHPKGGLDQTFHSAIPAEILKACEKVEVPPGRSYHTATDVGGMLVICGGFIEGKSVRGLVDGVNQVYFLDAKSGVKCYVPPTKGDWPCRAGHSVDRMDESKLLLFGGEHAKKYYNDAHIISSDLVKKVDILD